MLCIHVFNWDASFQTVQVLHDRPISCLTFPKKFISFFKNRILEWPKMWLNSRKKKWDDAGYISSAIPDEKSQDEEDDDDDEEEDTDALPLSYLIGNVMHPQKAGDKDAIICHCVGESASCQFLWHIQRAWFLSWNRLAADESGRWGRGGVFDAISERSPLPGEHYRLAHRMGDLAVGDVHLVRCDDRTARNAGGRDFVSTAPFSKIWLVSSVLFPTSLPQVALLVAHKRDKNGYLLPLSLSILERCFTKVRKAAQRMKGTTVCLSLLIYHILSVWMNDKTLHVYRTNIGFCINYHRIDVKISSMFITSWWRTKEYVKMCFSCFWQESLMCVRVEVLLS